MGNVGHTASSVDGMFGNAKEGVRVLPIVATPPDLVKALSSKSRLVRIQEPMDYHAICKGKVQSFPKSMQYHCFEVPAQGVRAREAPETAWTNWSSCIKARE